MHNMLLIENYHLCRYLYSETLLAMLQTLGGVECYILKIEMFLHYIGFRNIRLRCEYDYFGQELFV
jgi:hypothetical protein